MEKIFINDIAGSILYIKTATNEAPGGGAENSVTDVVKNKVISTGIGTWYLTFDGTSANAVKAIAVLGLNTGTWTTLKAQASDNNFSSVSAEIDLTVVSRKQYIYDESKGRIVDVSRYDAYAFVDWNYQDYRIKLDSTTVTNYEIGRVYFAEKIISIAKESEYNQPADYITTNVEIIGQDGQNIQIPAYQQFNYSIDFQGIDRDQVDTLIKEVAVNPTVCYFIDDSNNLFFGRFTFEQRRAIGKVFEADKIFLTGRFSESG